MNCSDDELLVDKWNLPSLGRVLGTSPMVKSQTMVQIFQRLPQKQRIIKRAIEKEEAERARHN